MSRKTLKINLVKKLIRKQTVVTFAEVCAALGPVCDLTVHQVMTQAGCRTSYSHNGRYYTLDELVEFDQNGLWSYNEIRFSREGTLTSTLTALIEQSSAGLFARDLQSIVKVDVLVTLTRLSQEDRVSRKKVGRRYLYISKDPGTRRRQRRKKEELSLGWNDTMAKGTRTLLNTLNEKQRRLFAGWFSLRVGRGGDRRVSKVLGMARATVTKGRRQLLAGDFEEKRIRKAGGGRKSIEKKKPEVIEFIQNEMECDTAGDPCTGQRWYRRTTHLIASALTRLGIPMSDRTVSRILKSLGFSLRVNHKQLSARKHPDRNLQFRIIAMLRTIFTHLGCPIISVDTKKKELIGLFRNAGTYWRRTPHLVNDHDFRSLADGIAIPYGIYDLMANTGAFYVGLSHDTPEFSVDCTATWWGELGRHLYPDANELLILADSGGSNGCHPRAWKYFLQHKLANPFNLTVTVAHYPSGASKWNPIEHRVFSEVSKSWAGIPLKSLDTMLNCLNTTTTQTGLTVTAELIEREYERGIKISEDEMSHLNLEYNETLPRWNYIIKPQIFDQLAPLSRELTG